MKKIGWWFTKINGELERNKLLEAFENRQFSLGKNVQEFEEKMAKVLDVPYVIMTNSGSSALTMALLAVNIKPGDEVIVPALTWIATAQAVQIIGAKVILADCQKEKPLIDIDEVEKKITSKTKAIIPVHLNGRSCNMERLLKIGKDKNISIIEDTCKAMTSKNENGFLGTIGDMGCFSLGMMSLVSSGGYGGFVVTRNKEYYEKLKYIRDHGVHRGSDERYKLLGFNFKISDLLAAIGIAQLEQIKEKRQHIDDLYKKYEEGLSEINYIKHIPVRFGWEAPLMIDVQSENREEIITYLAENGVEAERFHIPLHFSNYDLFKGEFPNATKFSKEGFVLPSGPSQPFENAEYCIKLLKKFNSKNIH